MRAQLRILEDSLVERIVDEALEVLATTGLLIEHPASFERLVGLGLDGDPATSRVRFPRAIVEAALKTAPSGFTLHDRDGNAHAELGGNQVHFVPASSALRVLDHQTEAIRDPVSADLVTFAKVANHLPNLSYLSTAFIPADVPQGIADAWRLYLVLSTSPEPVVSGAFTADGVGRMGRLLEMFRDGREDLAARPLSVFTCCPNTPLRWGEDPIQNLMDCAEWGIPVEVVPVLLLGMIAPATTVGALVLHTAEVLSGVTVAQLIREGSPVLFGGAPAAFHMQLMTNPMTSVEALQVCCGYADIARHLGLPSQAYMALSDAKGHDMQAGFETGVGAFLAATAGIHSVSGPGMLDYVNCFSLEKLVFDDEVVAHAKRFVRPVEVKEDLPVGPLIDELLADNHLLTSEHTLKYWPDELYLPGKMVDRTNWDQFEEQGSRSPRERALEVIEEALDEYEEEPLDRAVHDAARDLFRSTGSDPDALLPEVVPRDA